LTAPEGLMKPLRARRRLFDGKGWIFIRKSPTA
jgi:hypothetical protein